MKILRICSVFFVLSLLLLFGCEEKDQEKAEAEVKPGTPLYYYNLGLDTSDPREKLQRYEEGLNAIESTRDTMLVSLLEGKVYALSRLGEFEDSVKWIDSLIRTAAIQQDSFYLAKGYYRKSVVNRYFSNPEKVFENAFLSHQVYLRMGDTALAGRRSLDMANAQFSMSDFTGSQETATEALKYLDKEKDSGYVSSAYNVVGLSYMNQKFFEDALKEYNNALRYATSRKDSLSYLHNIALVFKSEKKYDKALQILEKIAASEEPDAWSKSRFLDNLAYTRWLKDSTANIDSLIFSALEKRKEINDKEGLMISYAHLSDYYKNKDRSKAKKYAEEYLIASREISSGKTEADALIKLMELSVGREKDAYMDRFIHITDSLNEANSKAKYQFAKIRFDEERKQQEITRLEAENIKKTLEAERMRTKYIISVFSVLMLVFLAGIFFYYFRQRSRREKIRQIYLTEGRISKRIHDELANEVYNLMSQMEMEGSPETVNKLDQIYRRTRDISRETSEIETGKNFAQALVSNLSNNAGKAKLILRGEETVNWEKLAEEKKIVVYRVLQELMVNMKKHSGASFVAISFKVTGNKLQINYSDNGNGMEQESIGNGNGLRNIQNRIRTVNGKIKFETTRGRGFKAIIELGF